MKKLLKFMAILMIVFGLPTTAKALTNADDLVGANGWIYKYLAHQDTVSSTGEYSLSSSGYYDNNYIWISTMYSLYQSISVIDASAYDSVAIKFNSDIEHDSIPMTFSIGYRICKNPKNIHKGENILKFPISNTVGQIYISIYQCNQFTSEINNTISFNISNVEILFYSKNETVGIINKRKHFNIDSNNISRFGNRIGIKYDGFDISGRK